MDPRDRADAVLARAQARDGVVTPDNMTSPMDAANTQQIPRTVVDRIDAEPDPDSTTKLPSSMIEANDVGASDPETNDAGPGGVGDRHLTESLSTTPLPRPGAGAEQGAVRETTQPTRALRPDARQAPPQGRGEQSPDAEHPAEITEPDGLVPTVRTHAEQSYVSRRLEGL